MNSITSLDDSAKLKTIYDTLQGILVKIPLVRKSQPGRLGRKTKIPFIYIY